MVLLLGLFITHPKTYNPTLQVKRLSGKLQRCCGVDLDRSAVSTKKSWVMRS